MPDFRQCPAWVGAQHEREGVTPVRPAQPCDFSVVVEAWPGNEKHPMQATILACRYCGRERGRVTEAPDA